MPGNSKLLTLAAVGVIGVGAAMPYWSRSELSSPLADSSGQGAAASRIDAFIGQEQHPAQPEFVMPEIRKSVSLGGTHAGLDAAVPVAPSLNDQYPTSISPTEARQQLVDLSPEGYQRVSVARREPRSNSVESFAIPIDMPDDNVAKAAEPRRVATPPASVPQVAPEPQQPAPGRWQPQTTSIVANKPIMPTPEVQQPQPQQAYVPPVQPQPVRSFAPAQPRQRHRLVDGDTLPKLAERYLGRADLDWAIYEANRGVLSDPQLLPLRVEITIPSTAELDSLRQGGGVAPSAVNSSSATTMQSLQPLRPLGGQPHLRMTPLGSR